MLCCIFQAVVLSIGADNILNFKQFSASPKPFILPNFLNAFQWSLPFIEEKGNGLNSSKPSPNT
jgi:hypothetical protein